MQGLPRIRMVLGFDAEGFSGSPIRNLTEDINPVFAPEDTF